MVQKIFMKQQEIERVFLVKQLPADFNNNKKLIIRAGNFYDSNVVDSLRIRQIGDKYELTKKEGESTRERTEHIIYISKNEFEVIWPAARWKYEKDRYLCPVNNHTAELDIYHGRLKGYARVEVEFSNQQQAREFNPPDWFGEEITDFNNEIHSDIGKITFSDFQQRYKEKGIDLKPISVQ